MKFNAKIINKNIFNNSFKIIFTENINQLDIGLFKNLISLRKLLFYLTNLEKFLHNSIHWMFYINYDLRNITF